MAEGFRGDLPMPPEQLVELLAGYRADGISFRLAFEKALREVRYPWGSGRHWKEAFHWAEPELRAAYTQQPTPAAATMTNLGEAPTGGMDLAGAEQPGARVA